MPLCHSIVRPCSRNLTMVRPEVLCLAYARLQRRSTDPIGYIICPDSVSPSDIFRDKITLCVTLFLPEFYVIETLGQFHTLCTGCTETPQLHTVQC
ncbi:hypothetical protein GDO78_004547 [Eleutherodactylus coqui]|uniref:Uncharacterized protein n=1 Tax=Eleutherodactylus coqui TaxID=57060 RepID=A0A8J6ESQ4_ELECQ|nr:hypothetical protein GDO78_004547 [Eleutherodactylus coqui]